MSKRQFERRFAPEPFEVREAPDGTMTVRGYAAVYNYEEHGEVLRPGFLDKTMSENPNVSLLANHDGIPMARTKNYRGLEPTLRLDLDRKGLWFESGGLDVGENASARELVSAVARGDMGECSFAFWPVLENRTDDGLREILEASLDGGDVSIVNNAWYSQTSVELNGLDGALMALRSGLQLTSQQRDTVTQWVTVTLQVDDSDDLETGTDMGTGDPVVNAAPTGMSLALARALATI